MNIFSSFTKLKNYCEKEQYKGWDPYDGLNSKVFQALPFKKWDLARLAWIQFFKRSPFNFRKILLVPKGCNAKGLALLLTGYCNLYKLDLYKKEYIIEKINYLAKLLISISQQNYSGACWGYNFDWQSKAFFLPKHTPTIVASSFAVQALLEAYKVTKVDKYKNVALSCSNFIMIDLNRIEKEEGFMFSYSPLDNRAVYNATLLATKTLSLIYSYSNNEEHKQAAYQSAKAVCKTQLDSGIFPHSDQVGFTWIDSFHTGFKLESLSFYSKYCKDPSFDENILKGYDYWIKTFFMEDGTPIYYSDSVYPIDLHCTAQYFPTICHLGKTNENSNLSEKVANWAINNMQNKKRGYFYFQKTKIFTNKIAYMRWPQAWMFYGFSYYLLQINKKKNENY